MPRLRRLLAATLCGLTLGAPVLFAQPSQDTIEGARAYLAQHPTDSDLRVRLGNLLLRAGQLDEAAKEIGTVLQASPDNSDALLIMSLIHLRNGNAAGAEQVAAHGLSVAPSRGDLRLAHARALRSLGRTTEAMEDVQQVLVREPSNQEAIDLRRALDAARTYAWELQGGAEYDWFSKDTPGWQEYTGSLKRTLPTATIIGRVNAATRFGVHDQQIEADAYPKLRPGTYFYLNAGGAVHGTLYPQYRLGAEWYQSIGHGIELSTGYRRLGFTEAVDIYTWSATYYFGDSLATFRMYITPREPAASRSYHFTYRRYFGDGTEYVGVHAGTGMSREIRDINDLAVLNSHVVAGDLYKRLGRPFLLGVGVSYSDEERVFSNKVKQTTATATLAYRF